MSKTKAKIALNAFLNGMSDSLKKQATLKIRGFGTFKVNYTSSTCRT
ncbi:HU family DNA-binding protein [Candidatus Williamhamiltonella defendens]